MRRSVSPALPRMQVKAEATGFCQGAQFVDVLQVAGHLDRRCRHVEARIAHGRIQLLIVEFFLFLRSVNLMRLVNAPIFTVGEPCQPVAAWAGVDDPGVQSHLRAVDRRLGEYLAGFHWTTARQSRQTSWSAGQYRIAVCRWVHAGDAGHSILPWASWRSSHWSAGIPQLPGLLRTCVKIS